MAGIVTFEGCVEIGSYGSFSRIGQMELRLLTAVTDHGINTLWSDVTEASFPGYAPIVLPALVMSWDAFIESATADFGIQTWTLTADLGSPYTVLGAALYNQFVGSDLLWFVHDEAPTWPQVIQFNGDVVQFRFIAVAAPFP